MGNEEQIRAQIKELVKELYECKHKPGEFKKGDKIPYAGRVFDEREIQALVESSLDFWLTLGKEGEAFERNLAKFVGARFARLVNSGSSANLLAFAALTSHLLESKRIEPNSEVITLAAGFPTTVNPILLYNCVPVFVDIDPETLNIDVSQLEQARSEKTRAVMIAHTLGNPFNVDAVLGFCKKYDLYLIEDNCDALGSEYRGKKTGSFGHLSTISFYPAHQMTMGEGGAVLTEDALINRAVESLRDWGKDCWCAPGKDNTCGKRFDAKHGELPFGYDHKYVYSHIGYNLKPLDLQAAIGLAQLEKLPQFVEARKRNHQFFFEALKKYEKFFIMPIATEGADPCWFGFSLTLMDDAPFKREEITTFLEQQQIQTRTLFSGNLLRQPMFDELRKKEGAYRVVGDLINTDRVMNNTFWFGVYPGLSQDQCAFIVESFDAFMARLEQKV